MDSTVHNPVPMLWGMPVWVMPLGWVDAPKVVNVEYEDTLRIRASFTYVGPEWWGFLYGAIGTEGVFGTFDEIVAARTEFGIGEQREPRTIRIFVDVQITTALAAGRHYSIYVKLVDEAGRDVAFSPFYRNAIYVVKLEPEITNLVIEDYYVVQ